MNRCIAAILCLLYLSASTAFAKVHHHDKEHGTAACQACVWHNTASSIDVPTVGVPIVPPEFQLIVCPELRILPTDFFQVPSPSRGPPFLLS